MADVICPLCGKPNPETADECAYCQAPLKTGGFLASPEEGSELGDIVPSPSKPPEADKMPAEADVKPTEADKKPAAADTFSNLESSIPEWLKQTEAGFLSPSEPEIDQSTSDEISAQIDALVNPETMPPAASAANEASKESAASAASVASEEISNEEWLMSLLSQSGGGESASTGSVEAPLQEEPDQTSEAIPNTQVEEHAPEPPAQPTQPVEKPKWLRDLEAASPIKLGEENRVIEAKDKPAAEDITPGQTEPEEQTSVPEWVSKAGKEEIPPAPSQPQPGTEPDIASAELPGWLEALRPPDVSSPSGPVEDLSGADLVTAGPLSGLRGVISSHPSAIRAQKPPAYSIKLRVTDEQRARMEMMEALLADEQKPKPLPAQPIITSRNVFRLVIAIALLVPIIWMIIAGSQSTSTPQPGDIPGVVDFTQVIQTLAPGAPVLMAFDYEAGFSGEMDIAITNAIKQLVDKSAFLTLVSTTPSGPALAESALREVSKETQGATATYPKYTDLGYIPGGTMGLLGLANSPKTILPYSLESENVWADAPLNTIESIQDFGAVVVMTNDADIARAWIEQVGPFLQSADKPLLVVTSAQAEPLIRPYYEAIPPQVHGLVAGLAGGLAYGRSLGTIQPNGLWDALSVSVTVSVLIVLVGSIAGVVTQSIASGTKKEG